MSERDKERESVCVRERERGRGGGVRGREREIGYSDFCWLCTSRGAPPDVQSQVTTHNPVKVRFWPCLDGKFLKTFQVFGSWLGRLVFPSWLGRLEFFAPGLDVWSFLLLARTFGDVWWWQGERRRVCVRESVCVCVCVCV